MSTKKGGACPYCGKVLKTRGALVVHRTYCRKNPRTSGQRMERLEPGRPI